jgi:hypothetical protein
VSVYFHTSRVKGRHFDECMRVFHACVSVHTCTLEPSFMYIASFVHTSKRIVGKIPLTK